MSRVVTSSPSVEDPSPVTHARSAEQRVRRLQRFLLLATVFAVPVVFTRVTLNVFNTPKAHTAWLLAGLIGVAGLLLVGISRRVGLGRPGVAAALAVFALALLAATLTAPSPMRALMGDHARHAGLVGYTGAIILFATAATALRRDAADGDLVGDHPVAGLLRTFLATGIVVVGYGALQALDLDPLPWTQAIDAPMIFSTMGNQNFLAGWLAIMGAAALWGVLTRTWSVPWRVACALLALAALAVTVSTGSAQGPLAWFVGGCVVLLTRLSLRDRMLGRVRGRWVALVGIAAVLLGMALSAGIGSGPLEGVADGLARSGRDRATLWQTAVSMTADRPLTGIGLEHYGDHYHEHRPPWRAVLREARPAPTQAHNVALQLYSGGGLPLLVGWLAWVSAVGAVLVRGLRRLEGERRLLLGGVGAAWAAYLTQSMVSIDVASLMTAGWILGGAVLAAAPAGRRWSVALPRASAWALLALLAPMLVLGAMVWSIPVRAELAAGIAARSADPQVVDREGNRAMSLARWEPVYPMALAHTAGQLAEREWALALYDEAIRRNPRFALAVLDRTRLANFLDREEETVAGYERVIELIPTTPRVLEEAARHLRRYGRDGRAEELERRAEELRAAFEATR